MIYLDYNATTPVRPEVLEEMSETQQRYWGNPSSAHKAGQDARRKLEDCRRGLAENFSVAPEEVIFTSGGTESANLALFGAAAAQPAKKHIISSPVEHHAVLSALEELKRHGYEISMLSVKRDGQISPYELRSVLRKDTLLVSLMTANNETGVIFPLRDFAEVAAEVGVTFHTDAVQAVGKIPVDFKSCPVSMLSLSAHKFGGPKGAGALIVRSGTRLKSIMWGGTQEQQLRPGTENLPAIAGMTRALQLSLEEMPQESSRLSALREKFERALAPFNVEILGKESPRLCNTSLVKFPKDEGESLLVRLDMRGVAVSTGAACASAQKTPSHVLLAMGFSALEGARVLRFSFGKQTTTEDIDAVLKHLSEILV